MVLCVCVSMFQPLGASDYLEMSRLFDTIFIRHIPQLTSNKKTQARRLITLVDALYEHKVRCSYTRAHLRTPNCIFLLGVFTMCSILTAGAGGDSCRSPVGGHFRPWRWRPRTWREPRSDGRSGAEKGKSTNVVVSPKVGRSSPGWPEPSCLWRR